MKKFALFALLASPLFAAEPAEFWTVPCQKDPPAEIVVGRGRCQNGHCQIRVELRKKGKTVASREADEMLSIPSGKSEKEKDGWWFSEANDPKGEQGKTRLEMKKGKLGKDVTGVMVAQTAVGAGEGLPATAYEYYRCEGNGLSRVWTGNDTGNDALADVSFTDENGDGVDEIVVKGGSFSAGNVDDGNYDMAEPRTVFAWSARTKRFEREKKAKPRPKQPR